MRYLVALLLVSTCFAQVQGNLPQLQDSVTFQAGTGLPAGQVPTLENVHVGDVIDVCVATYDNAGISYPVDDSLGNGNYTLTPVTLPPQYGTSAGNGLVYHAYIQSAFAGSDIITLHQPGISSTTYAMIVSRYSGLGAVDGSVATGTFVGVSTAGGGTGTVSTTQTTTVNNDVLSTCAVRRGFGGGAFSNNTGEYGAEAPGSSPQWLHSNYQHAGLAGSQTVTVNTWNDVGFGNNDSFAMQTLAFKPSTSIAIADTVLPDAATSVAYSAQLHCIGGTNTQTYSIFSGSLPTGLSLNTSTGAITGTPSGSTQTVGFRCTDGTVTSATASLTITVYGGFGQPFVRSFTPNVFDINGSWGTPISVTCNDILVVVARGYDFHYDEGATQVINGVNNKISDSFGSTWHRVDTFVPGSPESALRVYVSSPLTGSGVDNVTLITSYGSAANPASAIIDIGNGEMVDSTVGGSFQPGNASGTLTASYTSVVNNTLLLSLALAQDTLTPAITLSMNSPFTNTLLLGGNGVDAVGISLWTYALIASPGTTTATANYTNANAGTNNNKASTFANLLIPIRPAPQVNACAVASKEKIRRQVW